MGERHSTGETVYKSSTMGNRTEPRELQVVPPQCEKWATAGGRLEKRAGDRSKRGFTQTFEFHSMGVVQGFK